MAQVAPRADVHDVVIIGSGAGGGTVTKVLADLGVKVLLMEAGPMVSMGDFKMLQPPSSVWHRGAGEMAQLYTTGQGTPLNFNAGFAANLADEPYAVAPGSNFRWFRSRVIGGRTNHYSRVQLRYADYDFKPHDHDGIGWNWPITYEDIAPYYDKAERLIGVTGKAEGIRSAPDGIFQTPAALKPRRDPGAAGLREARASAPSTPARRCSRRPQDGRPACHYCGQCMRGCGTASNYASSYVQIFPAMKTGNVTVVTNAMARELITDDSGKVTAVSYVDKLTGTEQQVRCRTVVLSAAACESARLLLNSKSPRHPQGLANENGQVGKYLDRHGRLRHVGAGPGAGAARRSSTRTATARTSTSRGGCWSATRSWISRAATTSRSAPAGSACPASGFGAGTYNRAEGYGLPMKKAIRESYGGTTVSLSGRGAMVPNEDCFCEIDPDLKDKWGIPVLRFHWKWSDYEINQVKHMQRSFREILETIGGTVNAAARGSRQATTPGSRVRRPRSRATRRAARWAPAAA